MGPFSPRADTLSTELNRLGPSSFLVKKTWPVSDRAEARMLRSDDEASSWLAPSHLVLPCRSLTLPTRLGPLRRWPCIVSVHGSAP